MPADENQIDPVNPVKAAVSTQGRSGSWMRELRTSVVSSAVYSVFCLLRSSWRLEDDAFPSEITQRLAEGKPVVVAHFHEDEWALLGAWSKRSAHTLVSLSADGDVMARFLGMHGWLVSRGSSSRGGAAGLIALIRSVKKSKHPLVTLAVDGPKGPRRRAKNGILKLAERLDAPVLVMGASADRCFIFRKSWSKAFIPLPFSRVRISYPYFLTPEEVIQAVERDEYAEITYLLEEKLKGAKSMAKEKL